MVWPAAPGSAFEIPHHEDYDEKISQLSPAAERALCSVVSAHHIYLETITNSDPFREKCLGDILIEQGRLTSAFKVIQTVENI